MSDRPEWFAPKRYGYGSGLPIAWQGWALIIGYIAAMIGSGVLLQEKPLAFVPIGVTATALLLLLSARTTKGGWRWRWGERD
jgi:hypothetical protein